MNGYDGPVARLILFDIDMTLIRTSGAGRSAVNTVLSRLFGVEQATAGIRFDGRTDRGIFLEALETHGLVNGDPDAAFEAFVAHYLEELPRGATSARPRACPASSRTATTTARTYRNRTPSSPLRCWQMGSRSLGANLGFVLPGCTCYASCI